MTRYLIQLALMILAVAFAWRKGGAPERAAAMVIASMYVLDPLYHAIWGNVTLYDDLNVGHLAIDLMVLAGTATIALRARRIWTLWLVSVQLVALIAHGLRWMSATVDPLVYALMTRFPSYLQIALLILGTELHRRRTLRGINAPSWRSS